MSQHDCPVCVLYGLILEQWAPSPVPSSSPLSCIPKSPLGSPPVEPHPHSMWFSFRRWGELWPGKFSTKLLVFTSTANLLWDSQEMHLSLRFHFLIWKPSFEKSTIHREFRTWHILWQTTRAGPTKNCWGCQILLLAKLTGPQETWCKQPVSECIVDTGP